MTMGSSGVLIFALVLLASCSLSSAKKYYRLSYSPQAATNKTGTQIFALAEDHSSDFHKELHQMTIHCMGRPGDLILVEGDASKSCRQVSPKAGGILCKGWDLPDDPITVALRVRQKQVTDQLHAVKEEATSLDSRAASLAASLPILRPPVDEVKRQAAEIEQQKDAALHKQNALVAQSKAIFDQIAEDVKRTYGLRQRNLLKTVQENVPAYRRIFVVAGGAHFVARRGQDLSAELRDYLASQSAVTLEPKDTELPAPDKSAFDAKLRKCIAKYEGGLHVANKFDREL
jgi:hypothetical protein